jgi:hypothetical protein
MKEEPKGQPRMVVVLRRVRDKIFQGLKENGCAVIEGRE